MCKIWQSGDKNAKSGEKFSGDVGKSGTKKNSKKYRQCRQSQWVFKNCVWMLTSRNEAVIYGGSSKASALRKYFASVQWSDWGSDGLPISTTWVTQLEVTVGDKQHAVEEINPDKCGKRGEIHQAILKPLATILSGPVCIFFSIP